MTDLEFRKSTMPPEQFEAWENALEQGVEDAMAKIKKYCDLHPTCEGCSFRKEHIGCEFRGKSPREWKI